MEREVETTPGMKRRLRLALAYFGLVDPPGGATLTKNESFVSSLFGYAVVAIILVAVRAVFGIDLGTADLITLAIVFVVCVLLDAARRVWRRGAA
jgi:small basic protein